MKELPERPDFDDFQRKAALDYNLHLLGDDQLRHSVEEFEQRVEEFWEHLAAIEKQGNRSLTCAEFAETFRDYVRMSTLREQINTRLNQNIVDDLLVARLGSLKQDLAKLIIMSTLLETSELLGVLETLDPALKEFADSYREKLSSSEEER